MKKTVTLFHGTQDEGLGSFTLEGIGRGGDRNSALGLFLCERPEPCLRYADPDYDDLGRLSGKGSVLVVEAGLSNAFIVESINQFFGLDNDGSRSGEGARTHGDFLEARARLIDMGHDCVATDGCMDENAGIWVILDLASIRSVRRVSTQEALELEGSHVEDYGHVRMGGDGILFPDVQVAAPGGP